MIKRNSLLLLSLLLFSACGPVYRTKETFIPPTVKTGKECSHRCLLEKKKCAKKMLEKREDCRRDEYLKAIAPYNLYITQQANSGEKIQKTQEDFANYRRCRNLYNDSECDENYKLCFINCGGEIIEEKECMAFCDKE